MGKKVREGGKGEVRMGDTSNRLHHCIKSGFADEGGQRFVAGVSAPVNVGALNGFAGA